MDPVFLYFDTVAVNLEKEQDKRNLTGFLLLRQSLTL